MARTWSGLVPWLRSIRLVGLFARRAKDHEIRGPDGEVMADVIDEDVHKLFACLRWLMI